MSFALTLSLCMWDTVWGPLMMLVAMAAILQQQ